MKSVLSYAEYLYEKKNIDQNLSKGAPAKGSKVTKMVDDKAADLPKGKGSAPKKMVDPKSATLPKGKGSAPKKMVDTKAANVTVKGKTVNKMVNSKLAK